MKRTILYFDDEAACLNLFRETFGDEYEVRIATTLAEAWRMLDEQPAAVTRAAGRPMGSPSAKCRTVPRGRRHSLDGR